VRGYSFVPLHKNVPKAALEDSKFYELLALVDALRDGRARERELAGRELKNRLEKSTMTSPNLELLEIAAERLRPLLPEIVFVGGCATGLLVTDPEPLQFAKPMMWMSSPRLLPMLSTQSSRNGCVILGFRRTRARALRSVAGDIRPPSRRNAARRKDSRLSNRWYAMPCAPQPRSTFAVASLFVLSLHLTSWNQDRSLPRRGRETTSPATISKTHHRRRRTHVTSG